MLFKIIWLNSCNDIFGETKFNDDIISVNEAMQEFIDNESLEIGDSIKIEYCD